MATPAQTPDEPNGLDPRPQPTPARRRKRPEIVEHIDEAHIEPVPGVHGEGHFRLAVEREKIRAGRARDMIFGALVMVPLVQLSSGELPAEVSMPVIAALLGAWVGRRLPM